MTNFVPVIRGKNELLIELRIAAKNDDSLHLFLCKSILDYIVSFISFDKNEVPTDLLNLLPSDDCAKRLAETSCIEYLAETWIGFLSRLSSESHLWGHLDRIFLLQYYKIPKDKRKNFCKVIGTMLVGFYLKKKSEIEWGVLLCPCNLLYEAYKSFLIGLTSELKDFQLVHKNDCFWLAELFTTVFFAKPDLEDTAFSSKFIVTASIMILNIYWQSGKIPYIQGFLKYEVEETTPYLSVHNELINKLTEMESEYSKWFIDFLKNLKPAESEEIRTSRKLMHLSVLSMEKEDIEKWL